MIYFALTLPPPFPLKISTRFWPRLWTHTLPCYPTPFDPEDSLSITPFTPVPLIPRNHQDMMRESLSRAGIDPTRDTTELLWCANSIQQFWGHWDRSNNNPIQPRRRFSPDLSRCKWNIGLRSGVETVFALGLTLGLQLRCHGS